MLIAPELVEQQLTPLRVKELNAGILMDAARSQADVTQALKRLFAGPYWDAARTFAGKYASHNTAQAVARVTEVVVRLARG